MPKHEPERTCIFCRKKGTKDNFYKIVISKDGKFAVETDKKLDGRGAYICKNETCVSGMIKAKSLSKVLKKNILPSVYEEIKNELKSVKN